VRRIVVVMLLIGCGRSPHAGSVKPPPRVSHDETTIASGDVKLHVVMDGVVAGGSDDAVPLIIVSDGPGLSHEDIGPLVDHYAHTRHVITWDQRGVPPSTAPHDVGDYDLQHLIGDVDAIVTLTQAKQVDVIGWAWGGVVALAYAGAHGDRVRRLMLIDPFPAEVSQLNRAEEKFVKRVSSLQRRGLLPAALPDVKDDDCAPRLASQLPAYFADPAAAKSHKLRAKSCRASVFLATWNALGFYDLRPSIAQLQMPIVVLQGDADPFGLIGDDVVAALPSAREIVLPRCGHIPFEECADELYRELDPFL
jgi:proline iminopeptidase